MHLLRRVSFFMFFSVGLFLLAGRCAHAEIKVNNHPFEPSIPVIEADPKGNTYIAYYSTDGNLYIKKNNEPETKVSAEGARGEYTALAFFGDDVVLVWRPKFAYGKHVYAQRSTDGGRTFLKPVVLSTINQAIPPIGVVSNGENALYVVWIDESSGYNLHLNYSTDGGKTFLEKSINLTPDFASAHSPQLIVDGEDVYLFFIGREKSTKGGGKDWPTIFYKRSQDRGRTWSKVFPIWKMPGNWAPSAMKAVKAGDNFTVLWAGIQGLYGAHSSDGKEWREITAFKESEKKDVNRLQAGADKRGNIFIATSWHGEGGKPNIYFYRSEDKGVTWSAPSKVNTNEYNSTSSQFPAMHVSSEGTVFVAWQDHRDIRGDIYINYSRDFGKTWLRNDVNIEENPGRNSSFFPHVANYRDTYHILWTNYTDDSKMARDIFKQEYRIK